MMAQHNSKCPQNRAALTAQQLARRHSSWPKWQPANLVEAHSFVHNDQQSCFRAMHIEIVQYNAGRLDPQVFDNCRVKVLVLGS